MGEDKPQGQSNANWSVAIVHGIGKTEPIEMIREVTAAIKTVRPELTVDEHTRVHESEERLHTEDGFVARGWNAVKRLRNQKLGATATTGSAWRLQHVRHGKIGKSNVRFATAYWSDVALIGDSLVQLIGSLALGGLGVRYFADVSTAVKTPVTMVLHGVLMTMIYLLALGFLPLVVSSLLVSTMALFGYHLFQATEFSQSPFQWQAPFIAIGTLALATTIAGSGVRQLWTMRKERRLAIPLFSAIFCISAAVSILLLLDHPRGLGPASSKGGLLNSEVFAHQVIRLLLDWWSSASGDRHWMQRVALLDETSVYLMLLQFGQYFCGFAVIALAAIVLVLLLINFGWLCVKWSFRNPRWERQRSALIGSISVTVMWSLILLVLWPENLLTSYVIIHFINIKANPIWPAELDNYLFRVAELRLVKAPNATISDIQQLHPLPWFDLVSPV